MFKLTLLALTFLLLSNQASAKIYHSFDGKVEYSSKTIDTKKTNTLVAASTQRSYLSFNPTVRFHLTESFFFVTDGIIGSEIDSSSTLMGFGVGAGYYFLRPGSKLAVTNKNLEYVRDPIWSPYVSLGYRQYSLSSSSLTVDFSGLRMELGTKVGEFKNLPFSVGFSYESLNSGSERTLTSIGLFSALSYLF